MKTSCFNSHSTVPPSFMVFFWKFHLPTVVFLNWFLRPQHLDFVWITYKVAYWVCPGKITRLSYTQPAKYESDYGSIFDLLSNIHWNSLSYECWLRGVGWWLSPIIPSPNTFDTFNIQLDFHKTKCMGSGCAKERLQMKITFACRACFRSIANKKLHYVATY